MSTTLTFGKGNKKLGTDIYTFSLPAGHTCPGAKACLARADKKTGKITDGKKQEFRCFSASMEWRSNVRETRWRNLEGLKGLSRRQMYELLCEWMPNAQIVRIHVGGDFFSEAYFLAWCDVAKAFPFIRFYAYTKSLPYWVEHKDEIPQNLRLTASRGGKWDHLINEHHLKTATVVFSLEEALALGLEIDHDDSHAYNSDKSFGLLLHGTQPKWVTKKAKGLWV